MAFDYWQSPSSYVTIAILDSGFDPHEDFAISRFVGGYDYSNLDTDFSPGPETSHGMGCMGIIASTADNTDGVAGISNNFNIIGQKISNDDGVIDITNVDLARAFSDAVLAGAGVVSCSWGCSSCDAFYDTTAYFIRKSDSLGAVVVFAVGNAAGQISFPARMPEVIAVGATDEFDVRWGYSAFGSELDVVAPSSSDTLPSDIWTLDQMGNLGYNPTYVTCSPQDVDYNCMFGGTSEACPLVAGIAALILQRRPDLVGNSQQIKEIIRHSSEDQVGDSTDTQGWDQYYGWGRVNAERALLAVVRGDANNTGEINISDIVYLGNYIYYGGPAPVPNVLCGDANGTGSVNVADLQYLIAYVFNSGPPPPVSFNY